MTQLPADPRRAELAAALDRVHHRIAAACTDRGRDPTRITLVVVTKTHPVDDVRRLAELGQRDVGESREQEASLKHAALNAVPGLAADLVWHFVGRLQSNKARRVAAFADLVHSLDRSALVLPLARGAEARGRRLGVLVQVSLDGDPARGGVPVHDGAAGVDRMLRLAEEVAAVPALELRGLMAVAPLGADPVAAFAVLPGLSQRLCAADPGAWIVSAGMSGDLEAAVGAGATHLRVGTAVLGARPPLG